MMNGSVIPIDILYNSSMGLFGSIINNLATVQYIHRSIGLFLLFWSIYILINQYRQMLLYSDDSKLAILIIIQFLLGVITLVTSVNIYFAILHQVNASLIVLACVKLIYVKKTSSI